MRKRLLMIGFVWLAVTPAGAQNPPHRTADGRPDLQGSWDNSISTPLERGRRFVDKEFFTDQDVADLENPDTAYERFRAARGEVEAATDGEVNSGWVDLRKVGRDRRTSLLVDPPGGKLPPLTPDGRARADARMKAFKEQYGDGPETLGVSERCLQWGAGPPLVPAPYNNYLQIVQTRDYVMILHENMHDVRVIPLDGRPHLPPTVRLWKGDGRGRWDGDTLVVDTTNFTEKTAFQNSGTGLHVVERFTRADADSLQYEFTVDDPATFTRPWTGRLMMTRTAHPIYEYACHEANYSMINILRGARAQEKP